MSRDQLGISWVHNRNPLRKPEPSEETPEEDIALDPLNLHCDICQMPRWMCECE